MPRSMVKLCFTLLSLKSLFTSSAGGAGARKSGLGAQGAWTARAAGTLALVGLGSFGVAACKDTAKESAAHASQDTTLLADLVAKDVGEIERGLPAGAAKLAPLVANGADPRQDIA